MNATQAENLRILIRHMDGLKRETLNMDLYFEPCNTPACALGEAAGIRALRDAGLKVCSTFSRAIVTGHDRVFGLADMQPSRLFGSGGGNAWKRAGVTPQEWAVEARKVLAENGYSMDDKPAPTFETFMAKVQEPVPLESAALFLFAR